MLDTRLRTGTPPLTHGILSNAFLSNQKFLSEGVFRVIFVIFFVNIVADLETLQEVSKRLFKKWTLKIQKSHFPTFT